ncbi:hypothetical protein [Maridesulfovibrio sp.]|uniref:hypothetical protein n=1 Tax=Maridesulfovibrio sp. TaxID=2795000 RepID=UPI0029F54126|nr:hypothetical protein [Maridesulfovibrio sp.]
MTEIDTMIDSTLESFNEMRNLNISKEELLDPVVYDNSNYETFEELCEDCGDSLPELDEYIQKHIAIPEVGDLNSLLVFACNNYNDS